MKRDELELNEYEALLTRNAVIHFGGYASIAVLVAIAALVLPARYVGYAGLLFSLNAAWGWLAGSVFGKQAWRALAGMQANDRAAGGF